MLNMDTIINTNVKKGSIILTSEPFTFVLSSKFKKDRCDYCFKSEIVHKCSGCHYVHYCNKNCQKNAWKMHKSECSNLKNIFPKMLPDEVHLMIRIILKLAKGGGDEKEFYTENDYKQFKDLMSNLDYIKKDEKRMDRFCISCAHLQTFFQQLPLSYNELLEIFGKMNTNVFGILSKESNIIGMGIYLAPSIIDHSCKPNTMYLFDGTKIIIQLIDDVKKFNWNKITVSYVELLSDKTIRRTALQDRYYFWCHCERCEQNESMSTAVICPNKFCKSACDLYKKVCNKCKQEFDEKYLYLYNEIVKMTAECLENNNDNNFDTIKICLKKQENILHHLNIQHVNTIELAFSTAVNLSKFNEAEIYGLQLISGFVAYYPKYYPPVGQLYLELGHIQMYLGKFQEAMENLKKAKLIFEIFHGEQHKIIRKDIKKLLFQAQEKLQADHFL